MTANYTPYVLVVDDDPDIRFLLCEVLEEEGYEVIEAADGVEAWDALRESERPVVVIVDHNMPKLDGPGLLTHMAHDERILARAAVVYTTAAMHSSAAHGVTPALYALLEDLSASILWKPFEVDDLTRAVTQAAMRLSHRREPDAAAHAQPV